MKKSVLKSLLVVSMFFLFTACAAKGPVTPLPVFQPQPFDSQAYAPSVDNFIVIFDASSSMEEFSNGQEKFTVAKAFVDRMNQVLPEMGQNAGLISFGHDPSISRKPTLNTDGMKPYTTAGFAAEFDRVAAPGGTSALPLALNTAAMDLDGVLTKTAVIVVSDGKNISPKSIDAATQLKDKFGSSLCIYTVLVGNDAGGAALLDNISNVSTCGFSSNADDLMTAPAMAAFVEKVFLDKKMVKPVVAAPMDSDGDGVIDALDKCPDTPHGVSVDASGCPFDSDKDGVYDYKDQCPGTPLGANVNDLGCWILAELLFDYNKADIKPTSFDELDNVAMILKKNPALKIDLQGHTDNIGSKNFNMKLSLKRSAAVKTYLVSKGVPSERLKTEGFGFSRPVDTNKTKEGRAKNRRVELLPIQ
ncbi:OmpA family protein [Desulforapulum autotrophicum]|uniref:OmpA family protein n=1 Tax=Desulforapulum autotrophicum TaxID=2296 RepID=UPI00030FB57F|nr:OmpA family protein [Desulforapulum autotrophicum]